MNGSTKRGSSLLLDRKADMSNSPTSPKPDRRVRRSQKRLFDALLELILEKDYESITVSEIAERADLARATFYLHFDDKDALLLSSLDSLAENITEQVKQFSQRDLASGAAHPALVIFQYIGRDPALFRVILSGQGGSLMLGRLRHYVTQAAHQALESMGQQTAFPLDVLADFMAGAMLSVISGWLEKGMRQPPEEMARLFYSLVRPSVMSVLGVGPDMSTGKPDVLS